MATSFDVQEADSVILSISDYYYWAQKNWAKYTLATLPQEWMILKVWY